MHRSHNIDIMKNAVKTYLDWDHEGFDYQDWLDGDHVMLVEGNSVGLATCEHPGIFTGHYFFNCHGRSAVKLAKKMLDEMFTKYGARIMRGMTRPENRKAIWMNRHLGFISHGIVNTRSGPHEIFTLTKDDFYGRC